MCHAIRHGLAALFASALYATGAAALDAATPEPVAAGADTGAIVLAQAQDAAPPPPPEPTSEPAAPPASPGGGAAAPDAESEGAAGAARPAGPEPQVDTKRKVWLGLMALAIIATVVWLFWRIRPKTNLAK